jgi:hypothetical protein
MFSSTLLSKVKLVSLIKLMAYVHDSDVIAHHPLEDERVVVAVDEIIRLESDVIFEERSKV